MREIDAIKLKNWQNYNSSDNAFFAVVSFLDIFDMPHFFAVYITNKHLLLTIQLHYFLQAKC